MRLKFKNTFFSYAWCMSIMISSQEEMQTLGFYDLNKTDGSENSEKLPKMSKGPKKALKIDPLKFPHKMVYNT